MQLLSGEKSQYAGYIPLVSMFKNINPADME